VSAGFYKLGDSEKNRSALGLYNKATEMDGIDLLWLHTAGKCGDLFTADIIFRDTGLNTRQATLKSYRASFLHLCQIPS